MCSGDDISRPFYALDRNATEMPQRQVLESNPSLAIMFSGLLFQYGAGTRERVYFITDWFDFHC